MATSMVSTVLGIEREAEEIIEKAKQDSAALVEDARKKSEDAAVAALAAAQGEIKKLEAQAVEDRTKKIQELTASGKAALSKVKSISDSAFEKGVKLVMNMLSEK